MYIYEKDLNINIFWRTCKSEAICFARYVDSESIINIEKLDLRIIE